MSARVVSKRWDDHFLALAHVASGMSKDRSTKVGAVIVGPDRDIRATGFNGFPRGCDDDVEARHERPAKYLWTEHAERNAIYHAARTGVSVKGCEMIVTCHPCADCARAIIQSGIARLLIQGPIVIPPAFAESCDTAAQMLEEVGVTVRIAP